MKKDTSALWYKDGREIKADENLGFTEGVLKLEIAQVQIWEKKPVWVYAYIYMYISVLYNCLISFAYMNVNGGILAQRYVDPSTFMGIVHLIVGPQDEVFVVVCLLSKLE